MIPYKLTNRRRDMKTLHRRKDVGEENINLTGKKVCKKEVVITCSISGVARHKRRYHGV